MIYEETHEGEDEFEAWMDLKNEWSSQAFGKRDERGPIGPLKHLKLELEEVFNDPSNVMEYADCIFLITDAAWRAGINYTELMNALWTKLEINKLRTWPRPEKDGVSEHVRT